MEGDIARFVTAILSTILWTAVCLVLVVVLLEILERRYHLMREIFHENSTAAAILGAAFVLGVFYTVTQIVIH